MVTVPMTSIVIFMAAFSKEKVSWDWAFSPRTSTYVETASKIWGKRLMRLFALKAGLKAFLQSFHSCPSELTRSFSFVKGYMNLRISSAFICGCSCMSCDAVAVESVKRNGCANGHMST